MVINRSFADLVVYPFSGIDSVDSPRLKFVKFNVVDDDNHQ